MNYVYITLATLTAVRVVGQGHLQACNSTISYFDPEGTYNMFNIFDFIV